MRLNEDFFNNNIEVVDSDDAQQYEKTYNYSVVVKLGHPEDRDSNLNPYIITNKKIDLIRSKFDDIMLFLDYSVERQTDNELIVNFNLEREVNNESTVRDISDYLKIFEIISLVLENSFALYIINPNNNDWVSFHRITDYYLDLKKYLKAKHNKWVTQHRVLDVADDIVEISEKMFGIILNPNVIHIALPFFITSIVETELKGICEDKLDVYTPGFKGYNSFSLRDCVCNAKVFRSFVGCSEYDFPEGLEDMAFFVNNTMHSTISRAYFLYDL